MTRSRILGSFPTGPSNKTRIEFILKRPIGRMFKESSTVQQGVALHPRHVTIQNGSTLEV